MKPTVFILFCGGDSDDIYTKKVDWWRLAAPPAFAVSLFKTGHHINQKAEQQAASAAASSAASIQNHQNPMVAQIDPQALRMLEWLRSHISDHSFMVLLVDQTRDDWNGVLPRWFDDLYRQHLHSRQVRNRFGFFLQEQLQFIMWDHGPSALGR